MTGSGPSARGRERRRALCGSRRVRPPPSPTAAAQAGCRGSCRRARGPCRPAFPPSVKRAGVTGAALPAAGQSTRRRRPGKRARPHGCVYPLLQSGRRTRRSGRGPANSRTVRGPVHCMKEPYQRVIWAVHAMICRNQWV
jgi:hypothetical protein